MKGLDLTGKKEVLTWKYGTYNKINQITGWICI